MVKTNTLANLPYDIIRNIILSEGVSMGQMAVVSTLFFFRRFPFFFRYHVLGTHWFPNTFKIKKNYSDIEKCMIKVVQNDRIDRCTNE